MQVLRGTQRVVHKHAVHTTETMILKLYVVTDMDKTKIADMSSVSVYRVGFDTLNTVCIN